MFVSIQKMMYDNFDNRNQKRHTDNIKVGLVFFVVATVVYGILKMLGIEV